ncbi:unnamed protein product [Lactuca virosa]|uniref:Uncharacterized protein n=1 Tax=Lactuca virosa TaxID=75947 RepID=A0AAU9NQN7_9ASTR|nr:unnamed protein product [Lactuca virosa]
MTSSEQFPDYPLTTTALTIANINLRDIKQQLGEIAPTLTSSHYRPQFIDPLPIAGTKLPPVDCFSPINTLQYLQTYSKDSLPNDVAN